jgi:hypothetical protein
VAEETLEDACVDFTLGQDSWHRPNLIQPNQYWKGVNVTTRGGALRPRPPFKQKGLIFPPGGITTKYGYFRSWQDIFTSGKFQAAISYFVQPRAYILVIVSGYIFRVDPLAQVVEVLSETVRANQYTARIPRSNAGRYVVFHDFPNRPIIVSGNDVWRSKAVNDIDGLDQPQVPVSVLGTYNQSRYFIANAGAEFTAGDPVGNILTPEAPITFAEVFTPSSPFVNQFFELPTDESVSEITAMGFIQEIDQSTGIGPLFVATKRNIYAYQAQLPRDQWTADRFGTLLLAHAGIAGPRAFTNVNSDVLFLSGEGMVHAFTAARNDAKRWGNVSISREVQNYLDAGDPALRQFAVLAYFDNRVLISANPYRATALDLDAQPVTDYASAGVVVLEIDNAASLLAEGTPSWAGVWTGVDVLEIVTLEGRCWVFGKQGENALYELEKTTGNDIIRGEARPVKSVVYAREFEFGDRFSQKRLKTFNTHLEELRGLVKMKIEYKPTHSSRFLLWASWQYEALTNWCAAPLSLNLFNGVADHNFKELIFGDPVDSPCDPITGEPFNTFTAVQIRLTLEGEQWVLPEFKMRAERLPYIERGASPVVCASIPEQYLAYQCEPDWLIPEVNLCRS